MENIKVLKSNDFIRFQNNENNDNKRIFDLDIFYQKKYDNSNNKKNFNNNNYRALKSNYNIINNDNNNLNNKNIKIGSILSNDIEAENNIGKYKEKILNRSKIVEQNYKRYNEYQNNRYNKINLKYNDNYPLKLMRNNNGELITKTPDQKIYALNNDNTNKIGRRLYKSVSSGNVFQNNFYLSDFGNENKYNNIYNREYMGKKRTDITNNELINMNENIDNGFYEYCKKKMEVLLNNKKIVEDKQKQEKLNKYNTIEQEKNEIELRNKYFNDLNMQNKLEIKQSKLQYKNLLDEQIKNNINNKLLNENLTFGDVVQNQFYLSKKNNLPDREFLNKNRFVEINPYNHRNYYYLGDTSLKNNTIINPQIQYKTNKYIFPQNS